jgi:hypothetical protein
MPAGSVPVTVQVLPVTVPPTDRPTPRIAETPLLVTVCLGLGTTENPPETVTLREPSAALVTEEFVTDRDIVDMAVLSLPFS